MDILEVKNLEKIYKERDIFKKIKNPKLEKGIRDINFKVEEGDIFSIIGLNGAGKTTIMKCLLGLLDYDKGEINIFQKGKLKKNDLKYIGYLPEISYYPKSIKLEVLMEYYSELLELKNRKKLIDESLDRIGLLDRKNSKLEDFSKGMLQKVGIAQAIINKPKLLFLDEPMSGLDPLARAEVIELMLDLKKQGTTIFLNTHILDDIEKIGDKGIIVHKGSIIDKFNLKDMKLQDTYLVEFEDKTKVEVGLNEFKDIINSGRRLLNIQKKEASLEGYFRKKLEVRRIER